MEINNYRFRLGCMFGIGCLENPRTGCAFNVICKPFVGKVAAELALDAR